MDVTKDLRTERLSCVTKRTQNTITHVLKEVAAVQNIVGGSVTHIK